MAAAAVAGAYCAGPGRGLPPERVEQRRLAHAALADEHAGPPRQRRADLLDSVSAARAAREYRHAERPIRLQARQQLVAGLLVQEVGLVDHEDGPRAGLLDGHEVAVDEPRVQRRGRHGDDHDDEVDVGRDRPSPLRHVRVGAREQAAAGQHRGHAVIVAPALHEHAIADGEFAPLPAGEVGRQRRRHLAGLSVEQHRAEAGGDAGHDAAVTAGVRSVRALRGGSAAVRPAVQFIADQFEQEVLELELLGRPASAPAQRRLAQLGGALRQSVALGHGVQFGQHALAARSCFIARRCLRRSAARGATARPVLGHPRGPSVETLARVRAVLGDGADADGQLHG